jgi:spore coat protein U-like protein
VRLNSILLCFVFLSYSGIAWGQGCLVTTVSVNFGNYDIFSAAPRDATGEVNVTCDDDLPFTVKLDEGETSGGSFNPRVMRAAEGNSSIRYNLYRDSARQEIWGDGTGKTFVKTGTGTGIEIPLTVYGRIPARQNVKMGFYSDLINVTVEW